MNSPPYIPLYLPDHLFSTMHLTTEQHGAYFLLILSYWGRGGPLKDCQDQLIQITRLPRRRWVEHEPTLKEFFVVEDGKWWHPQLEKELGKWRTRFDREKLRPPPEHWAVIRARIFARDDYTCQYCDARGCELQCDHILPVTKGGTHADANLVTSCTPCNQAKYNKIISVDEWRAVRKGGVNG